MKTKLLILSLLVLSVQAEENKSVTPVQAIARGTVTKSLVNQATNTSWVDQKVEEIKPQRHGLNSSSLARLKSPFIVIKPKPKEGSSKAKGPLVSKSAASPTDLLPTKKDMSKEPLTLQIVLNSSALVNGAWLKEGDLIRGYRLALIKNNHVVLERKNKKIKLFIAQKNDNINISTK